MNNPEPKKSKIIAEIGISSSPGKVVAVGSFRMNFAIQHLMSAARFSRQAYELELKNKDLELGDFFDEILSNVMASIILSAAGVESFVNQLFIDSEKHLDVNSQIYLKENWKKLERKGTLLKYKKFLELKIGKSKDIYENIEILIESRNKFVHFQPEWRHEELEHKRLEKMLQGKFPLSPFMGPGASFFAQKCISHGMAEWSVTTAVQFIRDFCSIAELDDPLSKIYDRLNAR